jgi:hypothetical protein
MGFDELRGHESHGMAPRFKLAGPVVSASTSFHADPARRLVGKKYHYLIAFQLLAQYRLSSLVHAMDLEHVFG